MSNPIILLVDDGALSAPSLGHTLLAAGFEVTHVHDGAQALAAIHPQQQHLVLTHRMLLQRVWGPEYSDEAEYLRVYMSRLRRKLEADPAQPRYLVTEPGVGYRFAPDTEGWSRESS